MAQLEERQLPTSEIRGSNPVIGKFLFNVYCQLYWKDENKEKKTVNGPFKNWIVQRKMFDYNDLCFFLFLGERKFTFKQRLELLY